MRPRFKLNMHKWPWVFLITLQQILKCFDVNCVKNWNINCLEIMLLHFQTLWVPWEGMNRISLWLLRIFLVLATFFSGLEKTYSYLILNHSHTLETNPFPRLIIQNTGLLAGHIIGFGLSAILMCLLYKISIELDHPLTISVGGGILATAFSLYLSVFLYNLRNLQMLEAML